MKNIFIDCGYNMGNITTQFRNQLGGQYEYYAFEANPDLYEKYKNKHDFINLKNKAVWVENGEIEFYIPTIDRHYNPCPDNGGSTLLKEKAEWNMSVAGYKEQKKVIVECFDFSEFLKNNFNIDDNIIVKLDVEGAEYKILNKLIETNTASYINQLYVEFHDRKTGMSSNDIINKLTNLNVKLHKWH